MDEPIRRGVLEDPLLAERLHFVIDQQFLDERLQPADRKDVAQSVEPAEQELNLRVVLCVLCLTVSQLLDRWLDALKAKVSAGTYDQKEIHARVHLKPRIGRVRLAKLNGTHIEGLVAELRNDGVGPWATRHAIDALDYAINYAVRLKLVAANPSFDRQADAETRRCHLPDS